MLRRRRTGPPRGVGIGVFAGNPTLPQDPTTAIVGELQGALVDDAGIRVSETTGRQTYRGGGLNFQAFVRSPAGPNDVEQLEVAALQINSRRAQSRFRGRPVM